MKVNASDLRMALCLTGVLAAAPAMAQTTAAAAQPSESNEQPDTAPDGEVALAASPRPSQDNDASIVVTGSRIPKSGDSAPTPVTVATTEELQQTTPSNLSDALNKLPVFTGNAQQRGGASAGANSSVNAVGNYLNLRGIGANRNLILFDGNRFPATTQTGVIDVNTIPQLLIQRVEVVTGGASAVYGSDAVTGVVNFIVDKNFNGLKGFAQIGTSSRSDLDSKRLGVAAGSSVFGGRGHIEASYEYYDSDGLPSQLDRAIGRRLYTEQGAGTAANPFRLVVDSRGSGSSFGGLITSGPLAGQQFVAPGVLAPFVHGTATGSAGIESGGDGGFRERVLLGSLRSHQAFARFDYEVADDIDFHVQATGTVSRNRNIHSPFFFGNLTFASDNAFLPPAVQASLAGTSTFTFSRLYRLTDAAYNSTLAQTRSGFVNAGLDGKLGADFDWSIAYSYGRSRQKVTSINNINNPRLFAALDAVNGPGGIACRVTITSPGLYPGCVPLNPFGPGADDPAAIDYIMSDTWFALHNKLHDATATVTGQPFSTWAGPVRFAINAEFRHEAFENNSSSEPSILADCTGLRFNCGATTAEFVLARTSSGRAKQSVKEIAGEISLPLARDIPLIRSLDLTAAARHADYSSTGGATTWKIGLEWTIFEDLRLRGTRSKDIRAPTLNDLFAPATRSLTGFNDIHTNTAGLVTLETIGNPELVPEVAQTLTFGAVYKPNWLKDFSFAVDYYRIRISNAITTIGGNNAATLAECERSNGASPLCDLYIRPLPFDDRTPSNYPTLIRSLPLNVASLLAEGVDAEANFQARVGAGNIDLRLLASYMGKLATRQFEGAALIDDAGAATGVPKYKLALFASYRVGGFAVDLQERWRSSLKQSGNPNLVFSDKKVPGVAYTDLNVSYQFAGARGQPEIYLTIQNLFDKKPPVYASPAVSSLPGFGYPTYLTDDVIGRYFTLGVRARL